MRGLLLHEDWELIEEIKIDIAIEKKRQQDSYYD